MIVEIINAARAAKTFAYVLRFVFKRRKMKKEKLASFASEEDF